ncbi:MAG: cyclic dehypoxanthinyl futalosine synthase [bacterium]
MRIGKKEAIKLFSLDVFSLGKMADNVRKRFHPKDYVTFIIDRNITFTNICIAKCKFCAFFARKKRDGFLLSIDDILKKVEELIGIGGTQVMLQGGLNPDLSLSWYCSLLSSIKKRFDVWLHSLSPSEIVFLSKKENLSIKDVLISLKSAGLDSLPGAAEILCDRVRNKISPNKLNTDEWLNVMKKAHSIGMHTTATMTFGIVETIEERIEHLIKIRNLQDKTNGFKAFIPWTFSPERTRLSRIKQTGAIDYLKTLAISRLVLDNIPNIHSGWVTEGLGLSQIALFFGANDMGGTLMEEKVIKATGIEHHLNPSQMINLIKSASKIPVQRDSRYNIVKVYG